MVVLAAVVGVVMWREQVWCMGVSVEVMGEESCSVRVGLWLVMGMGRMRWCVAGGGVICGWGGIVVGGEACVAVFGSVRG